MKANNVVKKVGWFVLGVWATICLFMLLALGVVGLLNLGGQGWLMVLLSIGLIWSAGLNIVIALYSFVRAFERK